MHTALEVQLLDTVGVAYEVPARSHARSLAPTHPPTHPRSHAYTYATAHTPWHTDTFLCGQVVDLSLDPETRKVSWDPKRLKEMRQVPTSVQD